MMTQEQEPQPSKPTLNLILNTPAAVKDRAYDPEQPFKPAPSRAHVQLPPITHLLQTLPSPSSPNYEEYKRLQQVQIFPIYSSVPRFHVRLPRSPLERARPINPSHEVKPQNRNGKEPGNGGVKRDEGRKLTPLDWVLAQKEEEKWSGDWSMLRDGGMKRREERGSSSSLDN